VHVHVQYVGGRGGKGFLPVVTKLAEKGYGGWVNVEFTDAPAKGEGLEVLWANAGRDLTLVREAAGKA
jgi:sugar phosphate isomerase/epimerase